jgi:NADH dehydrogenase [ubiquinone] 1 alpha subcomplex assembly factor 3
LKRQRESGTSASGLSLKTKEGQDRFYQESRMATQYAANPFTTRIETPAWTKNFIPTAYTPDSVFINNKEVIGSAIITQNGYYHWNVGSFDDVNERTCALLLHLYPVPDILFIGTGRNLYMIDEDLKIKFQSRGTVVHCLPTGHALAHYMHSTQVSRRCAVAYINHVPTNGYSTECFGDFIENDSYCLSDTALGIPATLQNVTLSRMFSKVPEKYRSTQGTGIGPRYMEDSQGRLVRPGTFGTKLHPLLEPGEAIDWEKLPSYFNWYPKENLHDYIENTTFREVKGKTPGEPAERRALQAMHTKGGQDKEVLKTPMNSCPPVVELAPWDSTSLPITKFNFEKLDNEVLVEDFKSGRVVGMDKETYEKYKQMVAERKAGVPETEPVEFDQERYVADRHGVVYDLNMIQYRPIFEGRWNPNRNASRGFGHKRVIPH